MVSPPRRQYQSGAMLSRYLYGWGWRVGLVGGLVAGEVWMERRCMTV